MKKKIYLSILILGSIILNTSCDNQSKQKSSDSQIISDSNHKSVIEKNDKIQITDEMIENHIKNDPVKMKEIKKQADALAKKEVNKKILNVSLEEIFKKNPQQLEVYNLYLTEPPSDLTKSDLLIGLKSSITEVEGVIQFIQKGQLNGVNGVPLSLTKLLSQLKAKEQEVKSFKIEN